MSILRFDQSLQLKIPWLQQKYSAQIKALTRDHTPEQIKKYSSEISEEYLLDRAMENQSRPVSVIKPRNLLYVNMENDEIRAWLDVTERVREDGGPCEGWIKWLIADPKNKGFGSALLDEHLAKTSVDLTTLIVAATNLGAKKLYERKGFEKIRDMGDPFAGHDHQFIYMGLPRTSRGQDLAKML